MSYRRWGDIVGDYGRIGIDVATTEDAKMISAKLTILFQSKYSIDDSSNSLYFDDLSKAGSATTKDPGKQPGRIVTTVNSGSGWHADNIIQLAVYQHAYHKGTSKQERYIYAKLTDVDRVGGTMFAYNTCTIPPLDNYTVAYNANGGSGAPESQTKWYGSTLFLASATPTKTGHTFLGWAESASATTATYAAGGNYTKDLTTGMGGGKLDSTVTLYAVWKAKTYTVSYNANGGSGAPAVQTKSYGASMTLSTTKPTRTGYTFLGWAKSASATTATYAAGGTYASDSSITLYAVWSLSYIIPKIYNLVAERCDSAGALKEDGTYAKIMFDWETTNDVSEILVVWGSTATESALIFASGKGGSVSAVVGNNELSTDASYDITVTVKDSGGDSSAYATLPGTSFPIDCLAGGGGVAFGKPAELGPAASLGGSGVADFAFDAKFNKPVYGKALGMDRLPSIPTNSDLNDYIITGCYAVYSNAIAETVLNIPVKRAGRLEVWSSTGEGVRAEQWSYLRQRYIPYNSVNAVYEREVTRGESNAWTYGSWWRSSLTPEISEKIYSKSIITVALSDQKNLGTVKVYTQIPFDKGAYTGTGLALESSYVKANKNTLVRFSGQLLVKCGSVSGDRHARIQKVSGETTTSLAWVCITAAASSNTLFPLSTRFTTLNKGDFLKIVYYTPDATDTIQSGSDGNGWQSYFTVEEI